MRNLLSVVLEASVCRVFLDFVLSEDQYRTDLHDRPTGDILSGEDASA